MSSTQWLLCVFQSNTKLKMRFSPVFLRKTTFHGSANVSVNSGSKHYLKFYLLTSEQQTGEMEQPYSDKTRHTVLQHSLSGHNTVSLQHSVSPLILKLIPEGPYDTHWGLSFKNVFIFAVPTSVFSAASPLVGKYFSDSHLWALLKQIKVNFLHTSPPSYSHCTLQFISRSDDTGTLPKLWKQLIMTVLKTWT